MGTHTTPNELFYPILGLEIAVSLLSVESCFDLLAIDRVGAAGRSIRTRTSFSLPLNNIFRKSEALTTKEHVNLRSMNTSECVLRGSNDLSLSAH